MAGLHLHDSESETDEKKEDDQEFGKKKEVIVEI
jgi:hypothetical protein